MSQKRSHSLHLKKQSLKEFIKQVEDGDREIVEEDAITEIGQVSILSDSKFSLRRHTCVLDTHTSTYIGLGTSITHEDEVQIDPTPQPKRKLDQFRHLRGIFYVFVYGFFFSLSTILIKRSYLLAGSDNSIIRYFFQFVIMMTITKYKKLNCFGPKEQRLLLSVRGFIGQFALVSLHFSVTLISPSDSIAISNSSLIIASLLAWLFLKEKLTIPHILALLLTITGIIFISQPSFLFKKDLTNQSLNNFVYFNCSLNSFISNRTLRVEEVVKELEGIKNLTKTQNKCLKALKEQYRIKLNESIEHYDDEETIMYILEHAPSIEKSSYFFYLGILFALNYSICSGSVQIILKKLCMQKVHFAVSTIYSSYFGLPCSVLISLILFFTGVSHKHFNFELNFHLLPMQIFYSVLSALCGILSQICLNLALNYEDASKVSILKSIDLLFTFLLQFLVLKIKQDWLSTLGAGLILVGSVSVISYKIFSEKRKQKKTKKLLELKKNILNSELVKLTR